MMISVNNFCLIRRIFLFWGLDEGERYSSASWGKKKRILCAKPKIEDVRNRSFGGFNWRFQGIAGTKRGLGGWERVLFILLSKGD